MKLVNITFMYLLMFFLFSCVGTIKDNAPKTNRSLPANTTAVFTGVVEGGAISHTKIWVKFRPATGGSGEFNYLAYLNGGSIEHTSINGEFAVTDSDGFIIMTLSNLNRLTGYQVQAKVKDTIQNTMDVNNAYINVMTADDYLPIFDGVSVIENVGGVDAMTKLNVRWNPGTTDPNAPFDAKYSISGYSVYYSTSQTELWAVLRLPNQHGIDLTPYPNTGIKSVIDPGANSVVVDSLLPDTFYYIAVRARDADGTPRYEKNYMIKSSQTYAHQPIEFAGLVSTSVPKNSAGFSQVDTSWTQCVACGIYKVYAKPSMVDNGSIHPANDAMYLIGTVTNLALTSSSFAGLTKNTSYKVYMLACIDATCGWDGSILDERDLKGRTSSMSITSTPQLAPFAIEPPDPTPPAGEDGLSNLDITWQMDIAQGYYTKVRIFHVLDENGDLTNYNGANYVELHRTVSVGPYIDPAINNTPLDYVNDPTSARITNLTLDQEYCFQVIPFIEFPDLDNPGEEITLPVGDRPPVVCGTPIYDAPDFGVTSLFPSCSGINATDLTLNWTHPEIKNVMTHYEVYSKYASLGAFVFDTASGAWDNHGVGDNYVLKNLLLETQNSVSITGLVPNTQYVFGVNTYYDPPGLTPPIRKVPASATVPGNEALVYCTTQLPDVDHRGWLDIFAVGSKIDGLTTNQTSIRTVVPEFLLPDRKIPYEYGERFTLNAAEEAALTIGYDNIPGTGSSTGIVRLKWSDFTVHGTTERLSDYWESGVIGLGYNVYRVALNTVPPTDRPPGQSPLFANIMQAGNANWALATKLRFVIREHSTGNVAYTSDAITADGNNEHMISSEYVTTEGSNGVFEIVDYPPEEGKTYFYKVVGVFGGVESDFFDPSKLGNVVEVIVPPDNMALVHRWIANMEICRHMNRGVNEYCKSPNDQDGSFNENLCSDSENHYRCSFDGLGSIEDGDGNGVPDPYDFDPIDPTANFNDGTERYYDFARNTLIDRFETGCNFTMISGACPVSGDGNGYCIGTAIPVAGDGIAVGNTYYDYDSYYCYVKTATGWKSASTLSVATEIPTHAEDFASNNAYLPPLVYFDQDDFWTTYKNQTVTVDGVAVSKRLPMRKESTAAFAWHEGLVSAEISGMEAQSLTSTQDCNTNHLDGDVHGPDYSLNSYPYNGSIRTGSNGASSTALCVSRYGLQDAVGNVWEWNADRAYCNDATLECSTRPDDPSPNLANFTPIDESAGVSEVQDVTWRNGDGYNLGETGGTIFFPYQTNYIYNLTGDIFLSMAQGTPIKDLVLDDDNKLITPKNGVSAPIDYSTLNSDYFWIDSTNSLRGLFVGGYWHNSARLGRFAGYWSGAPSGVSNSIGGRGVVVVP